MSPKKSTSPNAFEAEIALIIKKDEDRIRKQLAGLRQILEYSLRLKPARIIRDTYYDTRENSLRERKITLRTRRIGGVLLISTKSDIRRISGNVIRRIENELPWSHDSVRLLTRKLELKPSTMSSSQFNRIPPSRALSTIGLQVIQVRRTQRDARDIFRRGTSQTSILAELVIDMVTYTFKTTKIGLSEVEIEAKAPGGLPVVRKIAKSLLSKYQPLLQQWSYGKFLTGLAIRKLLTTKSFEPYLADGKLKPDAFQLIEQTIQSGIE